ncbi:Uncharacterised protein [Clostridium perfringens]|nr:Uncharacterised protein [Clostridium perfringens]
MKEMSVFEFLNNGGYGIIMEKIKVYKIINKEKGIISVNFFNPFRGKKTTKSLGKEVGLNEEKAQIIIDKLVELINTKEYFEDYSGYLKAKEDLNNDRLLKMVFSGGDFFKLKSEEERRIYIDKKININNKDGGYRGKAIQFLGASGAGKTKTIQQLIGSIKYNTPASTTSNTTVSNFEAVINGSSNSLKMVASFLNKEELIEYLMDNVLKCIKIILNNNENNDLDRIIFNNIFSSNDMKLRLNFLLRNLNKENDNILNIKNILMENSINIWSDFSKERKINLNYREVSEEFRSEFDEYIEENKEDICEECVNILMEIIIEEMNKVISTISSIIKNKKEDERSLIFKEEFITNLNNYKKIDDVVFSKKEWPKHIYIEIFCQDNVPNKEVKDLFWNIYRNISCGDEDVPNLYALVASSRIEGNFNPLWLKDGEIKEAVIIDSEGFGHDVDKLVFSPSTIKYMQKVDMILWIIDSTKGMTNNDGLMLEELLRNGCLNKIKMCFNRLEKMDSKTEKSDEAKKSRIDSLINNLFKNYEDKKYDSNFEVVNFRYDILDESKRYYFDYLNEVIEDENGILKEEFISISEKLIAAGIDIEELKTKLNYTIDSFKKLVKYLNTPRMKNEKNESIDYYPEYSSSVLSRCCDIEILSIKNKIIDDIISSHWNTVRSFTFRMVYCSSNYRWWRYINPENDLKTIVKTIALDYLMHPINYDKCQEGDKKLFREIIQEVQNGLAEKIDEFVEKRINNDVKEKWKYALNDYGIGSGNRRKNNVIKIFDEIFPFDKNKREKNVVYIDLYKCIKENERLKDLKAKIEI